MVLAAAQINSKGGDLNENIRIHMDMIKEAAVSGADLILFPEMSLTGYEREKAEDLSFSRNDSKLYKLIQLAARHQIVIVAGAPVKLGKNLHIGAFILNPTGPVSLYVKKFLHAGEEKYYSPSTEHDPVISINGMRACNAICADIENPGHVEHAKRVNDCHLYLAGIFYSRQGILSAHQLLSGYAREKSICVLMANYSGEQWGITSGGKSAFWDEKGNLIAELGEKDSALLIVEQKGKCWKSM